MESFIRRINGHLYRITSDGHCVKARSSFAKEPVVGIAKCSECDTFDLEYGIKLAVLRCDIKIANKMVKRGKMKVSNYWKKYFEFAKEFLSIREYCEDATDKLKQAKFALDVFKKKNKF